MAERAWPWATQLYVVGLHANAPCPAAIGKPYKAETRVVRIRKFSLMFAAPLNYGVLVEPRLLGTSYVIHIDDVSATLHLPILTETEEDTRGPLGPPHPAPANLSAHLHDGWGLRFMSGTLVGQVDAILLAFECSAEIGFELRGNKVAGRDIVKLREQLRHWLDSFEYWTWVFTAQSLDAGHPDPKHFNLRGRNIFHVVVAGDETSAADCATPTIALSFDQGGPCSERAMDEVALQRVLACANTRPAPLALELLARARMACRNGDRRSAMVDIGTVVESALTRILGLPPDHRLTLGRLVSEAQNAGVALPTNIMDDLVSPRNDAVHRGEIPAHTVLAAALSIAEELVSRIESDLIRSNSLRPIHRPQRVDLVWIK